MTVNIKSEDNAAILALNRRRDRVVILLTGLLLLIYLGNLLLLSIASDVAALQISIAEPLNIAIIYSLILIALSATFAAIYSSWASNVFDVKLSELLIDNEPDETKP